MNIIAYRLPSESEPFIFQTGNPKRTLNLDPTDSGFIISPFDSLKHAYTFPFAQRISEKELGNIPVNITNKKFRDATPEEYYSYIEKIKEEIAGRSDYKVVASRRINLPGNTNPAEVFNGLCDIFPQAFVFYINTKETGCWVGATPELLLKKNGNTIESMALAGTRKWNDESKEWDKKNIEEQQIVTEYIANVFSRFCQHIEIFPSGSLRYGDIEHICTQIKGTGVVPYEIKDLILELFPTPALCGSPKDFAYELIKKHEDSRSLYGGFMGPVSPDFNFEFYVTIRCAFFNRHITLFGGGGITALSLPEEEWEETENKMASMKKLLNLS